LTGGDAIVAMSDKQRMASRDAIKSILGGFNPSGDWTYISISPSGEISVSQSASNFRVSKVLVGDSATALPAEPLAGRKSIAIYNTSSSYAIYIGASGVTTDDGYPIQPETGRAVDLKENARLYAVAPSGQQIDVRIWEIA